MLFQSTRSTGRTAVLGALILAVILTVSSAADAQELASNFDQLRVLIKRGDVMNYTATVEDPEVLAKPWTMTPRILKLSTNKADALLEGPPCVEHDAPHIVTLDHH